MQILDFCLLTHLDYSASKSAQN